MTLRLQRPLPVFHNTKVLNTKIIVIVLKPEGVHQLQNKAKTSDHKPPTSNNGFASAFGYPTFGRSSSECLAAFTENGVKEINLKFLLFYVSVTLFEFVHCRIALCRLRFCHLDYRFRFRTHH